MTVHPFPKTTRAAWGWRPIELQQVAGTPAVSTEATDVGGWVAGITEVGDPQLYLVGPAPEHDCIMCVSRLGRLYVLEDGAGRLLFEHASLGLLVDRMQAVLRRGKASLMARLTVTWCAIREAFEEKIEPIMAEPIELMTHFAPQLAAFA
ncbi:MAG: hypothetical protein JWN71_1258 [Xanthobacteraceae bacterium]|jgi:hypothetical protein|nr:hypothetical protein [Xanthobacteraceae bacterium]